MKYKFYTIVEENHRYFREIRGIRFEGQYDNLPVFAKYINKEYSVEKDGVPDLFFKDNGKDINFARYKANSDLTDIVLINPSELESNPRYIKERRRKLFLDEEIKQIEIDKKKDRVSRLNKLKTRVPSFADIIDEEISELEKQA